jgi:hypothetical protein
MIHPWLVLPCSKLKGNATGQQCTCGVTRKKNVNAMPHFCATGEIPGTTLSACGTSRSFSCPRATFWDGSHVWNNFLGRFSYVEQLFGTSLKRKGHCGVVQELLRARGHGSTRYNFLGLIGS